LQDFKIEQIHALMRSFKDLKTYKFLSIRMTFLPISALFWEFM